MFVSDPKFDHPHDAPANRPSASPQRRAAKRLVKRPCVSLASSLAMAFSLMMASQGHAQALAESAHATQVAVSSSTWVSPQVDVQGWLPNEMPMRSHPTLDPGTIPVWQQGIDPTPRRQPFEVRKVDVSSRKAEVPPSFLFLPNERVSSRSLGTGTHGHLVEPRVLDAQGEGYVILPRQRARGLNYGHQALIQLIERAAEQVAQEYPGSVLGVGNIGREFGGAIPYSVSHQIGHDADLAFYTTDPHGNYVVAPDLLHFNDAGISREYGGFYRFDVERNWAVVTAMMADEDAALQYLFISDGLKKLLMNYAVEQNVDQARIDKADKLLRQPAPYIPHDNHLHIRIFCTAEDLQAGCENYGRTYPWMPNVKDNIHIGIQNAAYYLTDEDPKVREAAVMRLGLLKAHPWTKSVEEHLRDDSPAVRQASSIALMNMGSKRAAKAIGEQLFVEHDLETIVRFLDILAELTGNDAAEAISTWLSDETHRELMQESFPEPKGAPILLYAIDALAKTQSLKAIPVLVERLRDPSREVRFRAARALTMVSNHRPDNFDWASPRRTPDQVEQAAQRWEDAMAEYTAAYPSRLSMTLAGMDAAGYTIPRAKLDVANVLARAAGDDRPYIRENAQRLLMQMTGKYPKSITWPASDARFYWTRYIKRHTWTVSALKDTH